MKTEFQQNIRTTKCTCSGNSKIRFSVATTSRYRKQCAGRRRLEDSAGKLRRIGSFKEISFRRQ